MKGKFIKLIKHNNYIYKFIVSIIAKASILKRKYLIVEKFYNFANSKKLIELENKSIIDYCKINGIQINILEEKQQREIYKPIVYNDKKYKNPVIESFEAPEIYYVCLNDTIVTGDNDVLIKDKYCLNDKFTLDYSNEIDFESGMLYKYNEESSLIEIDRHQRVIDKAISLIGMASNNYYHWVFDILSKGIYINEINELQDIPILIDECVIRHESYIELYNMIMKSKHSLIVIKRNESVMVKSLYCFSPCTWSSVYNKSNKLSNQRRMKSKKIINAFKNIASSSVINKNEIDNKYDKIFITRGSDKAKRLINENNLSLIAEKYGFMSYDPGQYSIMEQINVFQNTKYIIADEGAALTNLIWCKDDTKVFCIIPQSWNNYVFSTIAYLSGVECVYLDAKDMSNRYHNLDESYFEEFLRNEGFKDD